MRFGFTVNYLLLKSIIQDRQASAQQQQQHRRRKSTGTSENALILA
ncbi:MAG: hypothetical protein MUC60_01900 [Oscillatoria sp. Prado101]|nr:hypothetical protein [Oscillatoria sp. Prado101]